MNDEVASMVDPAVLQIVIAVFVGMALACKSFARSSLLFFFALPRLILSFYLLLLAFIMMNWMLEAQPTRVYPYILGMATGNPPYKVLQTDALKIALKVSQSSQHQPTICKLKNGRTHCTNQPGLFCSFSLSGARM